jgi:predicted nucleic acid-binding protein
MRPVVYDAGVLIAADRNDRERWAEHRVRLESGILPLVPSTVVAKVSRGSRQAQLRRFLRGCEIVALEESDAHRVGALLGKSRTADVVDVSVVDLAVRRKAVILTADPKDIRRLVAAAQAQVDVVPI